MQAEDRRLAPAARGGIPVEMRIPASERTSQKLNELLTQGIAEGDARSELIKLAVRKIVEEALEAEVAEAVGRGYYESGAVPGAGYRNGYRRGRLRTAEGVIDYGVPQVADRTEPFISRARAGLAGRTAELSPHGGHPHAVAPKGYYMLFAVNIQGVPSEGKFIFLH